jgi:hypothetical protein
MKQKDLALIVVIGIVSAVISLLVSSKIFVTPSNRQQKVEVVDVINSSFETPNTKYFNSNSIDPTQQTQIGNDSNQNPFNGAKP